MLLRFFEFSQILTTKFRSTYLLRFGYLACVPRTKRHQPTIERARSFARERHGRCLSKECHSAKQKLWWCCKNNHKWGASYDSVKRGSWCGQCAGVKKLSLEDAHERAQQRSGKCLSKFYVNGKAPLLWECQMGHRWKQSLNTIRRGHWCGKCHAPGLGQSIQDMLILAKNRGGKCLSQKYVTARKPLKWQCNLKHKPWQASSDDIKRGRWCPECSDGLGERICRKYFEAIFKAPFPSIRPDFLKNPKTGNNLELDGYAPSLNLAFEHQGRQHYYTTSRFSGDKASLEKRQKMDSLKRKLCFQHNVKLIEVPSVPDTLPLPKLLDFLKDQALKLKITFPYGFEENQLDLSNAFSPSSYELLTNLKKHGEVKGGKCLSKHYLGYHGKLAWQCHLMHAPWLASPAKILAGRWCPDCGGRKKKTIQQVYAVASSFGGRCLSNVYVNGKSKLKWLCKYGHRWSASFDSVSRGSRCPDCFNIRRKDGFK